MIINNDNHGGDGKILILPKIESKGKGAKLLPEHMRRLPGEIVTNDVAEGDKIHELDAPHIRSSIVEEFKSKEAGEKPSEENEIKKLRCAKVGETVPLSQWEIDVIRTRVVSQRIKNAMMLASDGVKPDIELQHLFFPDKRNVNHYELRQGKPRNYLPEYKHQRNYETIVDIFDIPERMKDILKAKGVEWINFRQRWEDHERTQRAIEKRITIADSLGVL